MFNRLKLAGLFCGSCSQATIVRARMNKGGAEITRINEAVGNSKDDIDGVYTYAKCDECSIYFVFGKSKCAMAHDISESSLNNRNIFLIYPDFIDSMEVSYDKLYKLFYKIIDSIDHYCYHTHRLTVGAVDIVDMTNIRTNDWIKDYTLYSLYKRTNDVEVFKCITDKIDTDDMLKTVKHIDELRCEYVRAEERARTSGL